MYLQILSIVAPIFTLAMVGYIWTKLNYNFPSEFIARIVMNIGAPCLIVSSLTQADIKLGELAHVVSAAMVVLIAMLVLGSLLIRTLKLSASTYLPSLLFPNNGNMGLSICLFTFSELGLALGIGIFMMQTVCQFTLGVFLVNDSARNWHDHLLELGKQPIVYAALFSIACVAWEYQLPAWASNTFQLMGGITIPLMLLTLGVSLAGFRSVQLGYTIWFAVIRLFGGFLLGLAVVEIFQLQGVMRGVVLIQASMPVAVFNYLLAVRYKQSPAEAASLVIVSTLLSLLFIPLLLAYVMP